MAATLYFGTDNGIFTLAQKNGGWSVQSQSLKEWGVHAIVVDPNEPSRVLAGTRGDGVWVSVDGGARWKKPNYGKPGPGKVRSLALDPADSKRVFAGGEPIELFVSDDVATSWHQVESVRKLDFVSDIGYPLATVEPHIRDIAVDPRDANTLYAALQVGGIIKTTNGGGAWSHIHGGGLDSDVHTIVLNAASPDVVVIATGGHDFSRGTTTGRALYRSANGGASWAGVAMEFPQEYSMPLAASPHDPKVMYSAVAHGAPPQWGRPTGPEAALLRSLDGGCTWQRLNTGMPNEEREFPKGIAVDPADGDTVYVAYDSGILTSHDGGATWRKDEIAFPRGYELKCAP
jgi:photosystem II stability/assembly factor-like uncharacterized protein